MPSRKARCRSLTTECPALRLRGVTFRYQEQGTRNILDHVDLDVKAGGLTVLMGGSGCGKSTLAAVAAGLYPENGGYLEGGDIELFGHPLREMNPQQRAKWLTILFQNPDLQFCMDTLRKEMRFCMENICIPAQEMDAKIERAAGEMGLQALLDRELLTLSGGEKQRAALACLYVMQSRCVLLDESFANLDGEAARELLEVLLEMKRRGRTIIAIDHQAGLWLDAADEIILLGQGARVAQRGINRDNLPQFREKFHELGLFYPGEMRRSVPVRTAQTPMLALRGVGIRCPEPKRRGWRRGRTEGEALLEDADASFPKGCMTAVLGRSGSGKTTTLLSVLGQHPYTGRIELDGRDISRMKPRELYRQVGIVFQNPANQFVTQNVEDEVRVGLELWEPGLSDAQYRQRADELLEAFGLYPLRRYSPYMLSQGQQRRLAVLSVIAGGQRLLLLDEPTYGQDAKSVEAIMRQLRMRVEQDGLTVIFITHDRALALAWADCIYELRERSLVPLEGVR